MLLTSESYVGAICMETVVYHAYYPVPDDKICMECTRDHMAPQFEDALAHESQYPVRWGEQTLNWEDYVDFLPVGFGSRWRLKEIEYQSPARKRVYCRNTIGTENGATCGAFLWSMNDPWGTNGVCKACNMWLCRLCGLPWSQCKATAGECLEARLKDMDDAREKEFEGLVRGKDYQICPSKFCASAVYLGEACNHMTCPVPSCRTHFCYLCGVKTEGGSQEEESHWDIGSSCPLYGRSGAENAIHFERWETGHEWDHEGHEAADPFFELLREMRYELAQDRRRAERQELELNALAQQADLQLDDDAFIQWQRARGYR